MKRHDTDVVSLMFGIVFCAITAWYFVTTYAGVHVDIPNGGWFVAAALILLGLIGVGASLRHNSHEVRDHEEPRD
jgi:hypothetical protein